MLMGVVMAVAVMVMVVTVVMIMVVVMMIAVQELRLDLQDAVEVEGVAAQHFRQRDGAALGLVQPWRRG